MPTQTQTQPTGARQPQTNAQRLPSIRAAISWLNPSEDGNVRANASLTIGGAFAVHGIRVINSQEKGVFVSMPSYKGKDGYKDIFHAVTAEARQQMNDAVLAAYEQKLAEQTEGEGMEEGDPVEAAPAEEGPGMQM